MTRDRKALLALTVAGVLWGLTVPLTKVALEWLDPLTLSVARFALAAPALALLARRGVRDALEPAVLLWGVVLYGGAFALQNIGVGLTSVSHAALVFGTVPAMVAALGLISGRSGSRLTWIGFGLALVGVALLTRPAGESSLLGDGLVLASAALSALFIAGQPSVLRGRDPIAVTAVQMAAGTLVLLPLAAIFEGPPPLAAAIEPMIAFGLLASAGSLLPFTLYAFAQSRVPAEVAGAFVNLEPLVGAAAGALAFGDPFGPLQMTGVAAILLGLALSTELDVRGSARSDSAEPIVDLQRRGHAIRAERGRHRAARPLTEEPTPRPPTAAGTEQRRRGPSRSTRPLRGAVRGPVPGPSKFQGPRTGP